MEEKDSAHQTLFVKRVAAAESKSLTKLHIYKEISEEREITYTAVATDPTPHPPYPHPYNHNLHICDNKVTHHYFKCHVRWPVNF